MQHERILAEAVKVIESVGVAYPWCREGSIDDPACGNLGFCPRDPNCGE
jgi:hypothetical protein